MANNYRSGFERTLAIQLKASKVDFEYETKKLPYSIQHSYSPDFILSNGIIIEAKGFLRREDIAKMRAVKATYPELDIRFVFMNAQKKIPGYQTTHARWADRHGYPWADGRIPDDWLI